MHIIYGWLKRAYIWQLIRDTVSKSRYSWQAWRLSQDFGFTPRPPPGHGMYDEPSLPSSFL